MESLVTILNKKQIASDWNPYSELNGWALGSPSFHYA